MRLALLAALLVSAGTIYASQDTTAKDLFAAAQERERAVRADLAAASAPRAVTRGAIIDAVAAYRLVVSRFPASGYCDDALWHAAQLSEESFVRFGNEDDLRSALKLLTTLITEYPTSRLVPRARAESSRALTLTAPPGSAAPAPPSPGQAQTPPVVAEAAPAKPPGPEARARAAAAPPPSTAVPVLVRDIRRQTTASGVDVDIEMEGPVAYREVRLDAPPRFFVDLTNTRTMAALRDSVLAFESGPVRQIRIGAQPNQTTRVVLELMAGAECHAAAPPGSSRLLVSCREAAAAPVPPAPAAGTTPPPALPTPVIVSGDAPPPKPGAAAATPAPAASSSPAAPRAPSANERGGYSIARQLGLRVGRIVIDAGHGGHDPGALAPDISEAAITLDIALRLEKLLAREPGIEVVLTRRTDEYVSLQERTAIANREAADLFVSIHVNAHRDRTVRGVETYLLNFASTPEAAAVAARENASSTLTMSHLNDLVKQIALENKVQESRDLAGRVQDALVRKLKSANKSLRDLGVKQAPFVVLVGAGMPSVLVEVAFLTYPRERELLASGGYRQRIAEALVDGIQRYLRTLKRVETLPDRTSSSPGSPARERLQ